MVTNLCFGLTCLLIPITFLLWSWQAALQLTDTGHSIVEALIICGIFWLLIQILHLDELLYYRYFLKQREVSNAMSGKVGLASSIEIMQKNTAMPIESLHPSVFHGLQMQFRNLPKNHREIKL